MEKVEQLRKSLHRLDVPDPDTVRTHLGFAAERLGKLDPANPGPSAAHAQNQVHKAARALRRRPY